MPAWPLAGLLPLCFSYPCWRVEGVIDFRPDFRILGISVEVGNEEKGKEETMSLEKTPPGLRKSVDARSCGQCFMFKLLDEYKELVRKFGSGHPLVTAYGYDAGYMLKDGICEVHGDHAVMRDDVCNDFMK
jgi:hypothetical protein